MSFLLTLAERLLATAASKILHLSIAWSTINKITGIPSSHGNRDM
jgi:hypothetical protein